MKEEEGKKGREGKGVKQKRVEGWRKDEMKEGRGGWRGERGSKDRIEE